MLVSSSIFIFLAEGADNLERLEQLMCERRRGHTAQDSNAAVCLTGHHLEKVHSTRHDMHADTVVAT